MGYLAIEIIALLGGATVLGFILGWALFGLGKKPATAAGLANANPKLEADYKAAMEARKKAEARVVELEAKEVNFTDRLHERDAKVAELSHQLDDLSKLRVEAAADKQAKEQRIQALEAQLRTRDAEIQQLANGAGGGAATVELQQQVADRERTIARLKAENEALHAAGSPDTQRVKELQAEVAELRATLVATAGAAPTTASEKDAIIGRLNEEVTGLRAAYEAAEQALEEQDAAIDKLTRELVQQQQRVAQLEGRETPATPRSGVTARPASAPAPIPTPAPIPAQVPAPAPAPVAASVAPTGQIEEAERTVAVSLADLVSKVDAAPAPKPAPSPAPAAPASRDAASLATQLAEAGDATVSVSVADLMKLVGQPGGAPAPAPAASTADTVAEPKAVMFGGAAAKRGAPAPTTPAPAAPPAQVEANESTVAISLASLVDQIDAAPATPAAPPVTVEANESTVAISLASLVDQIDAKPAPAPVAPPVQVEANESTVAISLSSLVDQIDARPAPPPSDISKRPAIAGMATSGTSEATAAFVVPAELLEDDDEAHRHDVNDIKRIKGIGKATAKRLRTAGITTWVQVANLTDKDLPAIADLLKVSVDKIKPWVEQAKALRQG
ncbi:MAG: hypothetical protein IT385_21085 [Deltaproteobacteria bacterium]|nr:hypothetical protein [Deltaproteobacteria bacterium]